MKTTFYSLVLVCRKTLVKNDPSSGPNPGSSYMWEDLSDQAPLNLINVT